MICDDLTYRYDPKNAAITWEYISTVYHMNKLIFQSVNTWFGLFSLNSLNIIVFKGTVECIGLISLIALYLYKYISLYITPLQWPHHARDLNKPITVCADAPVPTVACTLAWRVLLDIILSIVSSAIGIFSKNNRGDYAPSHDISCSKQNSVFF